MDPIILIGIFGAATVGLLFYGVYLFAGRRKAVLAQRLETYAGIEEEAALAADAEAKESGSARLFDVMLTRRYMQKLEENLAQADIPMRASEYILLRLVLAGTGLLL